MFSYTDDQSTVVHGTPAVVTPPKSYPVTLDEFKAHLRITDTNEDAALTMYLAAACELTESLTGRAFMKQVRSLSFDYFPPIIYLRFGPIIDAVGSQIKIEYIPADSTTGEYVELDRADYQRDISRRPRLKPAINTSWPSPRSDMNSVVVTYSCGYTKATSFPFKVKQAILFLASDWFNNRENITKVNAAQIPTGYQFLLDACKDWSL